MVYVAVLLAVAVLGGLAVWSLRRRRSDEMHSVAGYEHRRERLEELRRRQGGSVRVIGSTAPRSGPEAQPGVGEHGRIEISSSTSRRRVFDDVAPPDPGKPPPPMTYRRPPDTSIARMSHRSRRLGAPIAAAVAVIVLVTGLAIAGAHSRTPHSTTTTTIKSKKHHSTTATTGPTRQTTPTTAVPTTFSPASTNGSGATYSLPFASYTVSFDASSGACYVQITNSSGSTPYAQTLNQGSTYQIVLSGTSEVTLGAPSDVTVQIDGTPLDFPTPLPAPLHLTFDGAASTTTTSTP